MNQDPYKEEESHPQLRQNLRDEQEAFRLQEEKNLLEARKRTATFLWIINSIYFLVGLLEVLLIIRFLLRLFGANTQNLFAQIIYTISAPFITPFSTLFISPVFGGGSNIFDVNNLIAMGVYTLLGGLAIWMVRFIYGRWFNIY